ncbi:LacI family DNA-binding transcriptional regulator [Microbacterium sp. CIAB417]|uniref:LacI family DNA-binding transcriptional regulator n=1 Tax=Microbacterium sp. CIAB417 TaxID=2860287 RepID=UPI001FAD1E1C|nr:substrate-binding domain-containing protein [Microbacterium sp. CIAB417]
MRARRSAPVSRRERTGIVALAVPDLNEPYFAELTSLFVTRAHERGLSILIQQTAGGHEREVDIANGVGLPPIDGLIHIPRSLTVGDLTRRTAPGPIVLLGEHIQVSPFTHVTVDNKAGTDAATAHLAAAGCRRVAFVGRRDARPSDAADQRFAGYRQAVARLGLSEDVELIATVDAFTPEEGRRAMSEMLGQGVRCDGVVCSNDSLAFGVLSALQDAGLVVPRDVAVIGFDDVHAARFSTPALSSVAPDDSALVEAALDELERQMSTPPGMDMPVRNVVVGARIESRASTAR